MSPEFLKMLLIMMGTITGIWVLALILPTLFGKKGGKDE